MTSDSADQSTLGSDRPLFIVGCARSGTTLLQLALHAHPRIAIPPETRFLMRLYRKRLDFGDLRNNKNRHKVARAIIDGQRTKFRDLKLDGEDVRGKIVAAPPTIGSAIGVVFREYAASWGKSRWGDKRPNYILHLPVLLKLFPDAQIVHLIRDGRDCASSLKRMRWWSHGYEGAVHYWVEAIKTGRWARRNIPADQYYELRYEDLVTNPGDELRQLCRFLGEEFDEAMLEPHRLADEVIPQRKVWHEQTRSEMNSKAIGRWQEGLEPEEVALFERVAGRHLQRWGYQPSLERPRPPAEALYRYYRHAVESGLTRRAARLKDLQTTLRYGKPVAARLTREQRRLHEEAHT